MINCVHIPFSSLFSLTHPVSRYRFRFRSLFLYTPAAPSRPLSSPRPSSPPDMQRPLCSEEQQSILSFIQHLIYPLGLGVTLVGSARRGIDTGSKKRRGLHEEEYLYEQRE